MSDRLHEIAQHIANYGLDADSWFALRETAAESLKDTDSPHIIRTPEELEALDPDTCTLDKYGDFDFAKAWIDESGKMFVGHVDFLPAVVFATGDQVRAAREVMEATCTTHKN